MSTDLTTVTVEKLVNGGQGLGTLTDGRKVFVWNALPGEVVGVRFIKQKRSYVEAIAEEIIKAAPERVEPREDNYLATSPWQIMSFEAENDAKLRIVTELFDHEKITVPASDSAIHDKREWGYRNKMEYSFWGDDEGLHLALHQRGSHFKQIVSGSALAMPAIDEAARAICVQLNAMGVRAGDLKTIIVRASQKGDVAIALFVKTTRFPEIGLSAGVQGLSVYYSNPKSPASVPTKLLKTYGDTILYDTILDTELAYDPLCFFQANVPVFEQAVKRIDELTKDKPKVDFYSGVGSIGLSIGQTKTLVEVDPASIAMARRNIGNSEEITIIEATAETATDYIASDMTLIVDPPRAGLHPKVVQRILELQPPQLCYLSCNPATQARDLALLASTYEVVSFDIFNFFPHTPHIETLANLIRRV